MSYEAMDWALPKVIMDVNAKACLVVLAFHHNNRTGLCCPSVSTIADEMGVKSLNTVRKAIKTLASMDLLSMTRVFGEHGEISSTRYTLNLESKAYLPAPQKRGVVHHVKEGHDVKEVQGMKEGGSPHEGGVVHHVKGGGSPREGGVVHHVNPNKEIEQLTKQVSVTTKMNAPAPSDLPTTSGQEIEEKKPAKEKRPSRWILVDRPKGISPEAWKAYCQIRAIKRVPLTEKAWEGIEREAKKAGISLSEAIDICVRQGWAGFKSSWLENAGRCQGASKPTDPQYGIGVCQPPKEPTRLLTPEEVEESRRQMMEEGLIF